MRVVTIASDIDHPFLNRLLVPSCGAVDLDLIVLQSEKSDFKPSDKRAILTSYLTRHATPDELVLFTDAYDTLFIRSEGFIREKYADFAQGIVFSAELNSWPLGALGFALQESPPVLPYPYLNSGGFIGPAGSILELCAKYPDPPSDQFELLQRLRMHNFDTDGLFSFSDQYYWTLVHLLETQAVGLDNKAMLFECFAPAMSELGDLQQVMSDFRMHGREADSYQRERARLVRRLQSPSSAAQLHFHSPITKAATLDLFEAGELPEWLRQLVESQRSHHPTVQVQRV